MIFGRRLLTLCFVTVSAFSQWSWGWGQEGHRIVAGVGSKLAISGSKFWAANAENMVRMTSVPDLVWKRGQLAEPETVTHFFQPDSYFKDPSQFTKIPHDFAGLGALVGSQNAIKYGSAPWRINQFYNLALQALKKQDFQSAVIFAGVMSHYVGDLSQPLHVSENYDGQLTNDKGIHKFFETTNIALHVEELVPAVTADAQNLLKDPKFQKQFNGKVVDESFNETYRAFAQKDRLIAIDLKLGRSGEGAKQQLVLARERLADGAATLAALLSQMWTESGLKDNGATGQVGTPEWIKPDYYTSQIMLLDEIELRIRRLQLGDDCAE